MAESPLRIEKAVYGGDGLARTTTGQILFVPFALPGESVQLGVETGRGEPALIILEPSSARTEPHCVHFGRCGGCHYQMATYAAQLAMKQSILHDILAREDILELPPVRVWSSPEPWGYRNRVRLRVSSDGKQLLLGYNARGTHDFLPIQMCPIAAPVLWDAAALIMRTAEELPKVAGWLHAAHSIEISSDAIPSKVQMHLLYSGAVPPNPGNFDKLATVLRAKGIPLAAMAASRVDPASGRTKETLATWGAGGIAYQVEEDRFWLTPGNFFQINRFLVPTMVQIACGMRTGNLAWDLYAGVGLFSRRLSRQFGRLVAVEANPLAIQELRRGFAKGDRAVEDTTVAYLRRMILQRDHPDLIVLDPPRAGVGEEVCRLILSLRPSCIVYVSCDPTTLARDLRALTAEAYRITEAHMIDMFPQTYHLETVMVLQRKDVQAEHS